MVHGILRGWTAGARRYHDSARWQRHIEALHDEAIAKESWLAAAAISGGATAYNTALPGARGCGSQGINNRRLRTWAAMRAEVADEGRAPRGLRSSWCAQPSTAIARRVFVPATSTRTRPLVAAPLIALAIALPPQ
jgi:hypothetical protein